MARAAAGTAVERLGLLLFDAASDDPMADEVVGWLAGSARFRAFVDTQRDKIRKKLRSATDIEARRDVRTELRAAHLLLADRRIDLAFEASGSTKGGPDFTIAFRGERGFNVEVTRWRRAPGAAGGGVRLLAKLRQLPPSMPNVLLIAIEGDGAPAFDVASATRSLRARADAKDDVFFIGRGFDGARGFYQRYLRLGAVLVWCERADGEDRAALWSNKSARIAVPARAARACLTCLRAG
jgi:hypothetical protein